MSLSSNSCYTKNWVCNNSWYFSLSPIPYYTKWTALK